MSTQVLFPYCSRTLHADTNSRTSGWALIQVLSQDCKGIPRQIPRTPLVSGLAHGDAISPVHKEKKKYQEPAFTTYILLFGNNMSQQLLNGGQSSDPVRWGVIVELHIFRWLSFIELSLYEKHYSEQFMRMSVVWTMQDCIEHWVGTVVRGRLTSNCSHLWEHLDPRFDHLVAYSKYAHMHNWCASLDATVPVVQKN